MTRQEAIERVLKLLALDPSNNATDNEIAVAQAKAETLIQRFSIKPEELVEGEATFGIEGFPYVDGYINQVWRTWLANVSSERFGGSCMVVKLYDLVQGQNWGRFYFVGGEPKKAKNLFEHLELKVDFSTANALDRIKPISINSQTFSHCYRLGMVSKIHERLDKMVPKGHHLVPVTTASKLPNHIEGTTDINDPYAFAFGQDAGSRVDLNNPKLGV